MRENEIAAQPEIFDLIAVLVTVVFIARDLLQETAGRSVVAPHTFAAADGVANFEDGTGIRLETTEVLDVGGLRPKPRKFGLSYKTMSYGIKT